MRRYNAIVTTLTTSQLEGNSLLGGILFYTKENNKYRVKNKNTLVTNSLQSEKKSQNSTRPTAYGTIIILIYFTHMWIQEYISKKP